MLALIPALFVFLMALCPGTWATVLAITGVINLCNQANSVCIYVGLILVLVMYIAHFVYMYLYDTLREEPVKKQNRILHIATLVVSMIGFAIGFIWPEYSLIFHTLSGVWLIIETLSISIANPYIFWGSILALDMGYV